MILLLSLRAAAVPADCANDGIVASDGAWRGPSLTPIGHACHDFANVLGRCSSGSSAVAADSAVRAAALLLLRPLSIC